MMNMFQIYHEGKLDETLEPMDVKELTKVFRSISSGIPSKSRAKLLSQIKSNIEREWNKGSAFMK